MPKFPSNINGIAGAVTSTTEGATVSFQCGEGLFLLEPLGSTNTTIECMNIGESGMWRPNPASFECRPEGTLYYSRSSDSSV